LKVSKVSEDYIASNFIAEENLSKITALKQLARISDFFNLFALYFANGVHRAAYIILNQSMNLK
jgi:hypothetical protein